MPYILASWFTAPDVLRKFLPFYSAVMEGGTVDPRASLMELREFFDECQIVELTLLICAANFTNRFNDALRVVPDLGD